MNTDDQPDLAVSKPSLSPSLVLREGERGTGEWMGYGGLS
jgi:hypothetical protein